MVVQHEQARPNRLFSLFRNSHTEYSERYKGSVSAKKDKKPLPTSNIDMATYKKVWTEIFLVIFQFL